MNVKSLLAKPFALYIYNKIQKDSRQALATQEAILQNLIKYGRRTAFGRGHKLDHVNTYEQFKQAVPIRTYEDFRPYLTKIKQGKQNILWTGQPLYLAKTSGTTSGVKYLPISA